MNLVPELSTTQWIVFSALIFYIAVDVGTPLFLARLVDTRLGMVVAVLAAVYLFRNFVPAIAAAGAYALYILVTRSGFVTGRDAIQEHTPSQINKDIAMLAMNPPKTQTLEEEMVAKMAPVRNEIAVLIDTPFKPVAADIDGASKL